MERTVSELISRVYEGDRTAFDALVNRYRDMVYGLGYHLTRDFEAAQDLAQETFVQAYLKLGQLREPDKFPGWLRQIAMNLWRMQQRRTDVDTVALEEAGEMADVRTTSETEGVVREALGRLRESERLTLTLQYINGYTHVEIAGFMGVRPETIKTRLARARHKLRQEVLTMTEELFDEHALPVEFLDNVIRAVDQLMSRFMHILPPDLEALTERITQRAKQEWQEVLAQMPAPYGRTLSEQGGRPRVRVGTLPEELRQQVQRATCLSWLEFVLKDINVSTRSPWIRDFSVLWLRFSRRYGPQMAWFADDPTVTHYNYSFSIAAEDDEHPASPLGTAEEERLLAQCNVPELQELLRRLRHAIPGQPGKLATAMDEQMKRLLRQVYAQLPADMRETADSEQSLLVAHLPEALQELVRQAVFCLWGSHVLTGIESPPSWLLRLAESDLEFGLYRSSLDDEAAGKEYVRLYGPAKWNMQRGIYVSSRSGSSLRALRFCT